MTSEARAISLGGAGEPGAPFFYFSYGSNMDEERMRAHCPSARFISIARLDGHRLAFTLESRNTWHGGVPDILPDAGAEVWGALYLLDAADARALDEQEGVFRTPPAYERSRVSVRTPAGDEVTCLSYRVAAPDLSGIAPSPAFKRVLVLGARDRGLPAAYLARLEAVEDNGYAG